MEEETAKQHKNSKKWLQPYQFKKGQSGNPSGRKAGESMKEFAKRYMACLTEDEKLDFMHGLSKDIIWKMGEGNPESKTEASVVVKNVQIDPTDPDILASMTVIQDKLE